MKNILWKPSQDKIDNSQMMQFMRHINALYSVNLNTYNDLYDWSVANIHDFWSEFMTFSKIHYQGLKNDVLIEKTPFNLSTWFPDCTLNYAENCLWQDSDYVAIRSFGEFGLYRQYTYGELREAVRCVQQQLKACGVSKGDRVVGVVPNVAEAIVAMLATSSLGALWSSCSPDFGQQGVLDRFSQIEPKVLFISNGYTHKGTEFSMQSLLDALIEGLPSLITVVMIPFTDGTISAKSINLATWDDFCVPCSEDALYFEAVPFDHPLYVLYSSGTTGLPKSIVHRTGGALIQHKKELMLHCDLRESDTLLYFTTCGWMMWNWMVSTLAVGAAIVTYDGQPFYPKKESLWQLIQDEKVSVFGTSAKFLSFSQSTGLIPKERFDLSALRVMLSTGSPLVEEQFDYVYESIKSDLQLSSISGGTDIVSCFVLGSPVLPVKRGYIQCRGLGMAVEAYDASGKPVRDSEGELVCEKPFPSMPAYFWNDPDGKAYFEAYFDDYDNCWCHGDYLKITSEGDVKILGRSDTTLNPSGVRIGTAEIYRVVEQIDGISDSLAIGVREKDDEKIWLFVKCEPGQLFSPELKSTIRRRLKEECSPRHVPARLIQISDIPYTISGKKVELPVKKLFMGKADVKNKHALANPECLDEYRALAEEVLQL